MFKKAQVQLCVVHLVRHCLKYMPWKQRKQVAGDLRPIYAAPTADAGALVLEEFADKCDRTHLTTSQVWRRNWARVTPFSLFRRDPEVDLHDQRGERLNMSLRSYSATEGRC